jgi:hypothetical protein
LKRLTTPGESDSSVGDVWAELDREREMALTQKLEIELAAVNDELTAARVENQ